MYRLLLFFCIFITPKGIKKVSLPEKKVVETVSTRVEPHLSRIGDLELTQEQLEEKVSSLLANQQTLKTTVETSMAQTKQDHLDLKGLLAQRLAEMKREKAHEVKIAASGHLSSVDIASIKAEEVLSRKHVTEVIPAGTIVRCVVLSGADVSTGLGVPAESQKVLLRPLSNGWLPKGVRVSLKDAMIICSATANLVQERIYVRGERMTLTFANGDFIETDIAAYVSGEDGRGGARGIVIDKTWKNAWLASLASGMGTLGQALQSNTPFDLGKLGKSENNFIINLDTLKQSGYQASATFWDKMTEHLLKEKEKNAPFVILDQARIVDLIFLHSCELGETNLKEKFRIKRALAKEKNHG